MTALYFAVFLLILALVLILLSGRQRRLSGLPGGRIIYSDTRSWGAVEKPLFDSEIALTGKPDYLVEQNGKLIPVEIKTGRAPEAPYDSHIFQLASYCYLVHKTYGKRPPYGILHYPGRNFAIDYTAELESSLLDILANMRIDERRASVKRSHEQEARCRRCGFQEVCDEKLA